MLALQWKNEAKRRLATNTSRAYIYCSRAHSVEVKTEWIRVLIYHVNVDTAWSDKMDVRHSFNNSIQSPKKDVDRGFS